MSQIDNTPPGTSDNAADVDMPWAPRDYEWEGSAAETRALAWAGGDPHRLACVFLYEDKFPVTDIVDGEPRRVFRAVVDAAGMVDRVGGVDISEEGRERVRARITGLYHAAGRAFGDLGIRAPWEG
ncbi:hypothetical protein GCM10009839_18590 [Catenulispora yoronensis]|uniref:Uncharacterized protein n=1 Tax=Catenulispora yoronensis TaxID=450799 RepID=A0ABN2TUI6_9ACTN